jgi:hypothetical protein
MDSYDMQKPQTKRILDSLVDFVNRLPLDSKEDRARLLTKLIDEQFTTDPEEASKVATKEELLAVIEEEDEKEEIVVEEAARRAIAELDAC